MIDFDGIDGVLPEDVAARTDGGKGREVGVGNPDGEGGVFLSECLSHFVGAVEMAANLLPDGVLSEADGERRQGGGDEEKQRGVGVADVFHGGTRHDDERNGPKVIRQVFHSDNSAVDSR